MMDILRALASGLPLTKPPRPDPVADRLETSNDEVVLRLAAKYGQAIPPADYVPMQGPEGTVLQTMPGAKPVMPSMLPPHHSTLSHAGRVAQDNLLQGIPQPPGPVNPLAALSLLAGGGVER